MIPVTAYCYCFDIGGFPARNHGLANALTMFASSDSKHLLEEQIRAEIAGRYILRPSNHDPRRKYSKKTLAGKCGVCDSEKTIKKRT